ncbi:MAG: PspC domain-containing protein [Bacteroidetes bacterium]|nr:PspC domain-containing protein [Bacteroidota bacterium]
MEPKRLYRSISDRKFAGVAGGLAEYFIIDPLLIRLAFVILTLAGGGGFLIYLVLWIVTPENPARFQPFVNPSGPDSQPSNSGSPDFTATSDANTTEAPKAETTYSTPPPPPQTKQRNKGSFIGGMVLITLGVLFLADEFVPQVNFGDLWPVILIVVGVGLLLNAVTKRNRNTNQS